MLSQKILTLIFWTILFSSVTSAQYHRMLLRSNRQQTTLNSNVRVQDALETAYIVSPKGNRVNHVFHNINSAAAFNDTLSYAEYFTGNIANFAFDGHDVEMMWFEAPSDLTIKAAGFSCSDTEDNINNASVSLRLIKLNWTKDQLMNVEVPLYMGYYSSENDGMNNSAPFPDEATGDWIDKTGGLHSPPPWNPDDYDCGAIMGRGLKLYRYYRKMKR